MSQRKQKRQRAHATTSSTSKPLTTSQPFHEHLRELRRRFMFVAVSVLFWSGAAYAVQQHLVTILVKPSRGEHFIYTSPGGGIDFLFRICIYSGIVISSPVIIYNSLKFIEPLITKASKRFIIISSMASGVLAIAGVIFGYFLGLPAALHFLLHQFTTVQIQPLVTIQSYLSFVIVYMTGSALLFQLPLILLCINRLKPLKPSKLLHYERWVILAAFVLAGLMNPSPNVVSQLLVAGPFILMYQVGIGLIAIVNRSRRPRAAAPLVQNDLSLQQARHQRALQAQTVFQAKTLPPKPLTPLNQTLAHKPIKAPAPVAVAKLKPTAPTTANGSFLDEWLTKKQQPVVVSKAVAPAVAANTDIRNRYKGQNYRPARRSRQYMDGFMGGPRLNSHLSNDF